MPSGSKRGRVALVISDVDGTLLDPQKKLSPGAPAAVERLHRAGIRFTLTSARPPRLVHELVRDLHVSEPLACFNGALLVSPDGTILHQVPMIPSDAQAVADHIVGRGLDLWIYTGTDWYVSNPEGPHVGHQEELMGCRATPLRTHELSQMHVLKVVGVSDDYDLVAKTESELADLCCISISATRSSNYYLDVTHTDANKGVVVHELSRMLHILRDEIATIGDMPTDVLMFRQSGLSIAMGNASDEVKSQASYVTKSNEEDGFAWAMDHFVLGTELKEAAAD